MVLITIEKTKGFYKKIYKKANGEMLSWYLLDISNELKRKYKLA